MAQAAVLSVLKERPSAAQKEIAAALGLNSSALTAMIGRLLRLGYVTRERDENDGRAWRLALSANGRQALRAAAPPFDRINGVIEATLSKEEINSLSQMAARLTTAFAKPD